jgi:hypothetical protein
MADVAYCMKCREKREFEGSLVTLKNGRPALQGTCPVCGTKLTKILGMDAAIHTFRIQRNTTILRMSYRHIRKKLNPDN